MGTLQGAVHSYTHALCCATGHRAVHLGELLSSHGQSKNIEKSMEKMMRNTSLNLQSVSPCFVVVADVNVGVAVLR